MSSILDALERLEAESRDPAADSPHAWLHRPVVRSGATTRLRASLLTGGRKWLAASMLLAATVVAGWVGWRSFALQAADPGPAVLAAKRPARLPAAEPAAPAARLARRPPAAPASPAAVTPRAEKRAPKISAVPSPPETSRPVASPPPPADSLPLLPAGTGLSLQAISRAAAAEARIAVIGGRILHQGEDVQGYTLREIAAEAVVLCRSGECYRLPFAYRK